MSEAIYTPIIKDTFRGIGIDTEMWPDRCQETIFFHIGHGDDYERMENVSNEAVQEFIAYYKNQIALAEGYVANGKNPRVYEWLPKLYHLGLIVTPDDGSVSLRLPHDTKILGVSPHIRFATNELTYKIEHASLPGLLERQTIPMVEPLWEGDEFKGWRF